MLKSFATIGFVVAVLMGSGLSTKKEEAVTTPPVLPSEAKTSRSDAGASAASGGQAMQQPPLVDSKHPDAAALPSDQLAEKLRMAFRPKNNTRALSELLPPPGTHDADYRRFLAQTKKTSSFFKGKEKALASVKASTPGDRMKPLELEAMAGGVDPSAAEAQSPNKELEEEIPPLCYLGSSGVQERLEPAADVIEYEPIWARYPPLLVAAIACGEATKRCIPRVIRNDHVSNAEFRGRTIRFNWTFMEAQAASLGVNPNSFLFGAYFVGVLAHEYGHFMDRVAFESPVSKGYAAKLGVQVLGDPDAWDRELWADSVAGCVLARAELSTELLRFSLHGLSQVGTASHPQANERVKAVEEGWKRCSAIPPAPVISSVLLRKQ